MALRREQRRASKDLLALAVRKDFNAAMASEPETMTSFLYTVQNHGIAILTTRYKAQSADRAQTRTFECGSRYPDRSETGFWKDVLGCIMISCISHSGLLVHRVTVRCVPSLALAAWIWYMETITHAYLVMDMFSP